MKIKNGFILRKVPGMNLVMPTGKNVKTFNGSLMLNDTGSFGRYFSRTLVISDGDQSEARHLFFNSYGVGSTPTDRFIGRNVRPVMKQ